MKHPETVWLSRDGCTRLLAEANVARRRSYAPYSHFTVGAALLCEDGSLIWGCNVENAAYSPSLCAERVAIGTAIAAGHRRFRAIAIVGGRDTEEDALAPCAPCGVCRQTLLEFCDDDFSVILSHKKDGYRVYTLKELFPLSFSAENLKEGFDG